MKDKLLNFSKNLIIALGLVVIVMTLFFTTSSYAASGDTLGKLMRKTVSDWYRFILRVSMIVYSIGYLIIILKLLADRTPERLKIVKESILRFVIMFFVIYGLHYIMIMIMSINDEGITLAKNVGKNFSGIDMETDEYDLYQTALSKAYELSAVPGFIGLLMYLLLVYYTYKFVIVYAKRFINVIGLILLAPIIFVMSTIKKIVTGVSDGKIGKWFKEFIFNIVIQTLHAIFYAILIGLTLKLSDNNENLIGALLTLILFGFIFKIESIIRVLFNFVGGSTKINSSKVAGAVIDVTGGAINAGLGAIGGGAENLGNNIEEKGLKEGFNQSLSDGKEYFQDKAGQLGNKMSNMPNSIKTKTIVSASNFKSKTATAFANAKADAKDYDNILNGNRVKANLTADEIVAQQHIIDEGKGIEGARQKLQAVGGLISLGGAKASKLGKYTDAQMKKTAKFIKGRVKKGIDAAILEYKHDVENLENDIEMIKRIPRVIKSLKKKQKYIKTANGLNIDVSNTMMLVVDTDASPEEILKELKEKYGDGIDVSAYVFEKIGTQAFLSPAVGSPRMGMSVLAETKYEEKAEHKIDEALTDRKFIKRSLKRTSRRANRKARRTIKKIDDTTKTYKFSRFSPYTARKITNKMLEKSKNSNRYLFVLNKTYEDIQINNLKPRGNISKKKSEISRKIRITRKNVIKSIRKIKLEQIAAISNYNEVANQSRRVLTANNVAGAIMTAKNTIKLGFKQIDNMTPGQIGLRSMIKDGRAQELNSGLIAMKKNATLGDKLKLTGIVNQKENTVLQFVVSQTGELTKQFVTLDGQVVRNAEEEKELNKLNETVQQIVTLDGKIVQQVIDSNNTIMPEQYQVLDNGGEMLISQIQETLENGDIGLDEQASVNDKMNKFQDLLQDINSQPLLDQILNAPTETEDTIDEAILVGMEEAGISSMQELKKLSFDANLDDAMLQKKEDFNKAITDHIVATGIISLEEAEDDDIVGNALNVLNNRVQDLASTESDVLIDKAASMERVRIAEELLNMGEFTINNPPTDDDIDNAIDKKVVTLSELLVNLSKESSEFPKQIIYETVQNTHQVLENAAKGTVEDADLKYAEALKEAEKKWAKAHGTESSESIVDRITSQEKGEDGESPTIKITFKFFGGVEEQGQSVTLSNRYSIKDFYDKAKKLDSANYEKTQTRFMQTYGDKLNQMQLSGFTFAKNPVEDMDGWAIYVVTDAEDVDDSREKELDKKYIENETEQQALEELMEEYYIGISEIFTDFVEKNEIESFDDFDKNPDFENKLVGKLRTYFFRHGESNAQSKAKEVFEELSEDIRFNDLLDDSNAKRIAIKKAKDKKDIKITNRKGAEEEAAKTVSKQEERIAKEEEKSDLMSQILEDTIAEQEETTASQEVNDLLKQIREEVLVSNSNRTANEALKRKIMM